MALKHYSVPFVICPKWENEIEGIVLNRVWILGAFCPKQGQGFKLSAAHLNIQVLVEYPQEGGGGGFARHFYPGVGGNEGGSISKSCTQRGKWDLGMEKVKNMKTTV